MPIDIKVPSVGESITEGSIARWLKKDGANVAVDEPLFELETEKATQDVPAPAAGILHITIGEGKTVAIGAVVGTIEPSAAPTAPVAAPVKPVENKVEASPTTLSPAARRLASEEKVDVKGLAGTGRGGVVLKNDVQDHLEKQKPAEPRLAFAPPLATTPPPAARETRQRMSAIRQRIADRLLAAQKQSASLTTFNEADMMPIMDLRTRYKDKFKEKHDVGLGFMAFFVKACIQALKAFPLVNARIDDADIVLHDYYNIGLAVSTEKGLMVPVLRDADQMSFAQIERTIADLAVKARDGKINVADLQSGTFTITNGGVFGSMLSTPILNAPQSAILGMHAIQKRAVVQNDQIVIRPMMYLALTYDHRIIDGREAVLFLVRVKECLEDPERLLLEV
jgi:2-oxoglutarate dehydrogenase E2 component (dihydrolipoamide succinyltransferase)